MNTKGMKFLAVLAVLAMAFAAFAVVAPAETDDAGSASALGLTLSLDAEDTCTVGGQSITYNNATFGNKLTLVDMTTDAERTAGTYKYYLTGYVTANSFTSSSTGVHKYIHDIYSMGDFSKVMTMLKVTTTSNVSVSDALVMYHDRSDGFYVGAGTYDIVETAAAQSIIEHKAFSSSTASGEFTMYVAVYTPTDASDNIVGTTPDVFLTEDVDGKTKGRATITITYDLMDGSGASSAPTVKYDSTTNTIVENTYGVNDILVSNNASLGTAAVPAGKTLVLLANSASTTVNLAGTGSKLVYNASDVSNVTINGGTGNSVALTSFYGDLTATYGSVDINGENMHGTITVEGNVTIAGSIGGGDLTVKKVNNKNTDINIGDLTIADGCKLILDDDADEGNYMKAFISDEAKAILGTYVVDAYSGIQLLDTAILTVSGKVDGKDGVIDVGANAKLFVDSGAVVASQILGTGAIYMDDAYMEFEVARDVVSTITTTAQQKVTIVNNITIYSGNCLDVAGWLVIPEGVKLTIEDGAYLQVAGPIAKADIYGDVVIKGDNGLRFDGIELNIYGGITVKNESDNSAITVGFYNDAAAGNVAEVSGTITVNKTACVDFTNLTVADLGTVTINGTAKGTIVNYGTVVMKGTSDNFIVKQQAEAAVDIQSVTGTITVTDSDLFMNRVMVKNIDPASNGGYDPVTNTLTFTDAKGLEVYSEYKVTTSTITDYVGQKIYTNYMYVYGSLSKDRSTTTDLLNISEGTITVASTLNLGAVDMDIDNGAKVDVIGTIISTDEDTAITGSGTGELFVSGLVKLRNAINTTNVVINAVHYIDNSGEVTYYIYTNLADAIESGFEDFEVYGTLYITKDTTVPAGIAIECEGIIISEGVTFIIADGAELEANSTIYVYGTFEIENRDNVTHRTVVSDIESKTETTERYTNIYTALQKAVAGEKIRLTKTDSNVVLSKDAEIKEGVILEVPVNRTLEIAAGVTLTVNGTLNLNNGKLVAGTAPDNTEGFRAGKFATAPSYKVSVTQTNLFSCVKIGTGEIISTEELAFASYMIPGAYYQVKNKYYITTIEQSALDISSAVRKAVNVYGDVSATSAIFMGTANEGATVTFFTSTANNFWATGKDFNSGVFSAGDLTIIDGKFEFKNGYKATGTFTAVTGTIVLKSSVFAADSEFGEREYDDEYVAYVKGNVDVIDINKGIVLVPAEAGADLTIAGDNSKLTIASGATLYVAGDVSNSVKATTIDGTLFIANGGTYTAQKGDHSLKTTVKGTVEIEAGGAFNVELLYVGTAPSTSAAPSIIGPEIASFDAIVVYPGATIDSEIASAYKASTYYVEDKVYATAYAKSDNTIATTTFDKLIDADKIAINNGLAQKWLVKTAGTKTDGTSVKADADADGLYVGSGLDVYLYVTYQIYSITLTTEQGVDAVYFDGHLMTATGDKNKQITFTYGPVKAGTYKITWQLANGYSDDNASLYINGEKTDLFVVGLSGTIKGSDDKYTAKTFDVVLQGIEKSGYDTHNDEVPTEPETWTITTILLLVLVILIAVMAVIVALRLNRS